MSAPIAVGQEEEEEGPSTREWQDQELTIEKNALQQVPSSIRSGAPHKMLSRHGVHIRIESVAYLKSKETPGTSWAAIQLDLTFNTDRFEKALVPFRFQLCSVSPTTGNRKSNKSLSLRFLRVFGLSREGTASVQPEAKTLQLPFLYPLKEEVVEVTEETGKKDTKKKLSPSLGAPTPIGAANVEIGSRTTHITQTLVPLFLRSGAAGNSESEMVETCWIFRNQNTKSYPATHTLLVLIQCDPKTTDTPPFTFKIVLTDLEVENYRYFRNAEWEFNIQGNHQPRKVDKLLRDYKDGKATYITLAALAARERLGSQVPVPGSSS